MRYYSEKEVRKLIEETDIYWVIDTPEGCLSLMRGINIPDKHGRIVDLDKTLHWLANKKRAFSIGMTAKIINALKDVPVLVKDKRFTKAELQKQTRKLT